MIASGSNQQAAEGTILLIAAMVKLEEERMRPVGEREVLESVFAEMDPVSAGFSGLVELMGVGEATCSWRPRWAPATAAS